MKPNVTKTKEPDAPGKLLLKKPTESQKPIVETVKTEAVKPAVTTKPK